MTDKILRLCEKLHELSDGRTMTFMEVCGTHTVAIFRSGLRSLLPPWIRLLSGPGCPVCVSAQSDIDAALYLAREGKTIAVYGDMLRVPGSNGNDSLSKLKGQGADVRVVTSAVQCIDIARKTANETVFLGVGFETTAPATAVLIKEAARLDIKNLSVYSMHKTIPEALVSLSSDGFILPGNVSVIIGEKPYEFLVNEYRRPSVIAGFEPEGILAAIAELVRQNLNGISELKNFYPEAVKREGNPQAVKTIYDVFSSCDSEWRGLGTIRNSGLEIKDRFQNFDAQRRFEIRKTEHVESSCECGKILTGKITPPECPLFGKACTPTTPVGACMVSGEGTCGAWYRWNRNS